MGSLDSLRCNPPLDSPAIQSGLLSRQLPGRSRVDSSQPTPATRQRGSVGVNRPLPAGEGGQGVGPSPLARPCLAYYTVRDADPAHSSGRALLTPAAGFP